MKVYHIVAPFKTVYNSKLSVANVSVLRVLEGRDIFIAAKNIAGKMLHTEKLEITASEAIDVDTVYAKSAVFNCLGAVRCGRLQGSARVALCLVC